MASLSTAGRLGWWVEGGGAIFRDPDGDHSDRRRATSVHQRPATSDPDLSLADPPLPPDTDHVTELSVGYDISPPAAHHESGRRSERDAQEKAVGHVVSLRRPGEVEG